VRKIYKFSLVGTIIVFCFLIFMPMSNAAILDGLVGLWLLDEGKDKIVTDSSGNKNNGELVGTATWIKDGKFNSSLKLNGTSDSFKVPDAQSLHITDKITLMAWIRPALMNWGGIISKGDDIANHTDYSLWFNSGKVQMTFNWPELGVGAGGPNVGATTVSLNNWSHFAGTWDGKQIKVYINGKLDGTFGWAGPIKDTIADLYIGVEPGGGDEYYGGEVDEVAIFHRALEDAEIQQLMNGFGKSSMISQMGKLATAWGKLKTEN
jgi:hypothetical protein